MGSTKGSRKPGLKWQSVRAYGVVGLNKTVFARNLFRVVHLFAGPEAGRHGAKMWGSEDLPDRRPPQSPSMSQRMGWAHGKGPFPVSIVIDPLMLVPYSVGGGGVFILQHMKTMKQLRFIWFILRPYEDEYNSNLI